MGRAHSAGRLCRRRAANSGEPASGQAPRCSGFVAALLPLARAGEAPRLGGRVVPLVRRRQAEAMRHTSFATGAECRGDPPPHRATGARQGRCRAGTFVMEIRLTRHGRHVAIVTIDNQPRLNAMTRQMLAALGHFWDELERDECRCIILTGTGERAFTVGADISGDLSAGPEIARMVNHALLKNDPYSKPIIAAVNGDCVGGGLELMLSTDIRAAVPTARFGLTEVKWSIYPFGGSTIKLIQKIGYVAAMDLLLTARLIDAGEAARLGLVNRCVPRNELMGWAIETAEMIAANSPSAVQAVKRQVSATIADHALTREALEQRLGDEVRASPHFAEGIAAFREKRRPRYE